MHDPVTFQGMATTVQAWRSASPLCPGASLRAVRPRGYVVRPDPGWSPNPMSESDRSEPQADQPAEVSDRIKPWTIKGIPPEERNAALAAAARAEVSIGEWMRLAIRTKIKADRGADGKGAMAHRRGPPPPMDLGEMERLVAMVAQMQQATGEPPPKTVTQTIYARMRERMKTPVSPAATSPGPTATGDGQTAMGAGRTGAAAGEGMV